MRGVSRLWVTWEALIHVLAFRLQGVHIEKGILHRYDLLSEGTWDAQWSITAGDNPGVHDFACEVLDYGVLGFDRSQCIEFLIIPAVPGIQYLKSIYRYRDTRSKELCIDPTSSQAALMHISMLIVYTATQSQLIEHQRSYLHPFPSTLCPTWPGRSKLQGSELGFAMTAQELIAAIGSASIHVPRQITASIF